MSDERTASAAAEEDRGAVDVNRDTAESAGRWAERATAAGLDRLENFGLWVQQQGLGSASTSESFRDVGPALVRLRRRAVPLPRTVGRGVTGSTYLALRLGLATFRAVVGVLDETTRLLDREHRRQ